MKFPTAKEMMSDKYTPDDLLNMLAEIAKNPKSIDRIGDTPAYTVEVTRRITTICRAYMKKREEERNHVRSEN